MREDRPERAKHTKEKGTELLGIQTASGGEGSGKGQRKIKSHWSQKRGLRKKAVYCGQILSINKKDRKQKLLLSGSDIAGKVIFTKGFSGWYWQEATDVSKATKRTPGDALL